MSYFVDSRGVVHFIGKPADVADKAKMIEERRKAVEAEREYK
jgi:hypothetical protein